MIFGEFYQGLNGTEQVIARGLNFRIDFTLCGETKTFQRSVYATRNCTRRCYCMFSQTSSNIGFEYSHYENLPMIFIAIKMKNFQQKNFDIFLIFAQNIYCGYTLEPPRRGGSNEYPQSMFWRKNKKNRYTYPCITQFYYIKVGYKGVFISRTCFPDD